MPVLFFGFVKFFFAVYIMLIPQNDINEDEGIENMVQLDKGFRADLRYANSNNFVKKIIYPCAECWLRPEAAKALLIIQKELLKNNLSLFFFDCYRPLEAQKELWNIFPNPSYVTPPSRGSMHNRGLAVDLTVMDLKSMRLLDMGTDFDFFGKRAHQDNVGLPKDILENRKLLRNIMALAGFKSIRTEWWHYYYPLEKATFSEIEKAYWKCD